PPAHPSPRRRRFQRDRARARSGRGGSRLLTGPWGLLAPAVPACSRAVKPGSFPRRDDLRTILLQDGSVDLPRCIAAEGDLRIDFLEEEMIGLFGVQLERALPGRLDDQLGAFHPDGEAELGVDVILANISRERFR